MTDPEQFVTTHWGLVRAAGRPDSPAAGAALAELCETYWYPLYAEARRRGLSRDDACDRVQGFFARLLEKNDLGIADPARGRFRTFLLAAFGHFLANEWDRERASKRGGGRSPLTLDLVEGESRYGLEPAHEATAERIFDRRWAIALIDRALGRLRAEYDRADKAELFTTLAPALTGDRSTPYAELAGRLNTTEGAIKVAVFRLRSRCGELIRDEVAQTVSAPGEVDDELAALFESLGS